MKYLIIFILTVSLGEVYGGIFKSILYSKWITCDHNRLENRDVSEMQVYFYDFQNNINISTSMNTAVEDITSYHLDFRRKLIFFVPGYKSTITKNNVELFRDTFKTVQNTYLIIIDHSQYTSAIGGHIKSYERSVFFSYYIGRVLGNFLAEFHRKGYPSRNIHCVGHSLGAQMLGYAGEQYTNLTSEKICRITGLDPAGPCFSDSSLQDQLRSGLAEYVEVYHCNAGELGTTSEIADGDFFINSGKWQPHCHGTFIPGVKESEKSSCSHSKCVKYWLETVSNPGWFEARKCQTYNDFKGGLCVENEEAVAGYSNTGARGVFYASTESYGVF